MAKIGVSHLSKFRSITAVGIAGIMTLAFGLIETPLANAASSTSFVAKPPAGVLGGLSPKELKLWKFDKNSGKFNVVSGDASSGYTPHIAKVKSLKGKKIAFAEGWAANAFSVPINKGIYLYAKQAGVEVIYCDNQFKPDQAVTCAEQLASQKPDFVIESNWQGGVVDSVSKIFSKGKIPMVNVDVWHPGGIFFGANNYESGVIAGKAAGDYAKSKWNCKDVWVFLGENKAEGAAADLRLSGFADGVQEVCGKLPDKQIARQILGAGTADQAITVTTDWLTANPKATHIVATSIDDQRATGIAKAFVATKRDGIAVGQGADDVGIGAITAASVSKSRFLGTVVFFNNEYALYLMSIALDVLQGKPVPQEVHVVHKFLTHETVKSVNVAELPCKKGC